MKNKKANKYKYRYIFRGRRPQSGAVVPKNSHKLITHRTIAQFSHRKMGREIIMWHRLWSEDDLCCSSWIAKQNRASKAEEFTQTRKLTSRQLCQSAWPGLSVRRFPRNQAESRRL